MDPPRRKRTLDPDSTTTTKRQFIKLTDSERNRIKLWRATWNANQQQIVRNFNNHHYDLALASTPRETLSLPQHLRIVFNAYVSIKAIEHYFKHIVLLDLLEATVLTEPTRSF